MSFSSTAGTCIIPTLSRIVLCAAFLPGGYNKFKDVEFSGADAQKLIDLGVIDAPSQASLSTGRSIVLASFQDDDPTTDPTPAAVQDPPPAAAEVVEEVLDLGEDTPPAEAEAPATGTYRAKGLHHVTLLVEKAGLPAPVWMARLTAFTELVGGGLLFVGLFSRVWGLGIAIVMGVAFYVTSLPALLGAGNLFTGLFNLPMDVFTGMFTQLGLFVLAFGVFLTGAGPISLDRALFRKTVDEDDDEDEEV